MKIEDVNILALDVAFGHAAACLLHHGKANFRETDGDKPHSQSILPMLESMLEVAGVGWRDLNMLALGAGPGSFTGLRIASATFAGINASLQLPMLALPSLGITAIQSGSDEELYVIEDARSGDAYLGHYRQGKAMVEDRCLSWEEVSAMPPASFIALEKPVSEMAGWKRLQPELGRPQALAEAVKVCIESCDPARMPRYVMPNYIRVSQAERMAGLG